jgi:E3 ubiquitin-protein ligase SHPRH
MALAPQWVDELRAHAPGLRVFVYDGWKTLTMPITEEDAAQAREVSRAKRAKAKGKNKRTKGSAGSSNRQQGAAGQHASSSRTKIEDADDHEESEPEGDNILDWCRYINQVCRRVASISSRLLSSLQFDVCVTTYNVLTSDFNVAEAPVDRPRRATALYSETKRPRSPLIMCEVRTLALGVCRCSQLM